MTHAESALLHARDPTRPFFYLSWLLHSHANLLNYFRPRLFLKAIGAWQTAACRFFLSPSAWKCAGWALAISQFYPFSHRLFSFIASALCGYKRAEKKLSQQRVGKRTLWHGKYIRLCAAGSMRNIKKRIRLFLISSSPKGEPRQEMEVVYCRAISHAARRVDIRDREKEEWKYLRAVSLSALFVFSPLAEWILHASYMPAKWCVSQGDRFFVSARKSQSIAKCKFYFLQKS